VHTEDEWGNATVDQNNIDARIQIVHNETNKPVFNDIVSLNSYGWTFASLPYSLLEEGPYLISVSTMDIYEDVFISQSEWISVRADLPVPRVLYADLHVHSDDTVGTNSTTYNFSYAEKIAGLDIVGYTANDFNITKESWDKAINIIKRMNKPGELVIFPGTEWCGNSAAGGDHNVVFWMIWKLRLWNFHSIAMETSRVVLNGTRVVQQNCYLG
jgi:hypothetical protein